MGSMTIAAKFFFSRQNSIFLANHGSAISREKAYTTLSLLRHLSYSPHLHGTGGTAATRGSLDGAEKDPSDAGVLTDPNVTNQAPAPNSSPSKSSPLRDKDGKIDLRQPKTVDGIVFQPFYHFPYIAEVRAFVRVKFYQTALTVVMVPIVGTMVAAGNAGPGALIAAIGVNVFAFCSLLVMGQMFQRWIGRMYLDAREENVLVSHLTFFGHRQDVVVPLVDVIPLDDLGEDVMDAYVSFQRYSKPGQKLFYSMRWGGVLDEMAFKKVFGSVPFIPTPDGDMTVGRAFSDMLKKRFGKNR